MVATVVEMHSFSIEACLYSLWLHRKKDFATVQKQVEGIFWNSIYSLEIGGGRLLHETVLVDAFLPPPSMLSNNSVTRGI